MSLLMRRFQTADYCVDGCFASCQTIVWISFKIMSEKLGSITKDQFEELSRLGLKAFVS